MKQYFFLIVLFSVFTLSAQSKKESANGNPMHGTTEVLQKSDDAQPYFLSFKSDFDLPVSKLSGWVNQNMKLGKGVALKLNKKETDDIGMTHHRYAQYYHNIPVRAGVYYFHEKNGKIVSGNGHLFKLDIDSQPCVDPKTAQKTAERHINAQRYKVDGKILDRTPNFDVSQLNAPALIVISENLNYDQPVFRLAWEVVIYAVQPLSHDKIYVDAITGNVIAKENRICTIDAQGTAITKYNGTETITTDSTGPSSFRLYESGRGGGIHTLDFNQGTATGVDFTDTDNFWNNINAEQDEIATDAHYGTEVTYDYYFLEHGRNSYDGNGAMLISNVHFDFQYANAFWDGTTMTYGDGNPSSVLDLPLTTMDVCGHEITHGVTEFTADLIYSGESGGLNESFSDIFGNAIENYADTIKANWRIGEQCTSTGLGIRNMADPNEFNNPDTYQGNFWGGGVHNDSGVQNYWFYLLANGGSGTNDLGDAYNVNGIGWEKAEQIAYRNLSVYLSPSSNYFDARVFGIKAAEDLFGGCSQELIEVTNAWYAVGVGNPFNPVLAADFTASKETICDLPGATTFSALGSGISSHFWDFGDGNTSTLASPSHTYNQVGMYTVSLRVTDCNGVMDSLTKVNYINVDPMSTYCDTIVLMAIGVDSSNQCSGVIVDPGGVNNDYPDDTDVIFVINPPGQIDFQLTFNEFDLETGYDFLTVHDGPDTNSPIVGVYSGSTIPNPITSNNGVLTIHFTTDGSVTYPGFVISWTDISGGLPPVAAYTVPVPTPHNWPIPFDNQSLNSGNFFWDFGDGSSSTLESPTHLYSTSGATYNTSLISSNCAAADTAYQTLTIDAPSSITIDPDTICVTLNQGDTTNVPVTITNTGGGVGYYGNNISSGGVTIIKNNKEFYFSTGATTTHSFNGIPSNTDTLFLSIILNGDFDGVSEFADLVIDGVPQGVIVDNDEPNGTDILVNYVLTGPSLAIWLADENLVIDVVNNSAVGTGLGGDDKHEVIIQYNTIEWLDFGDLNGSTPANSQSIVDILFDARNVIGGATYTFDVPISTNDVNNPSENVHCKLTVIANAVSNFTTLDTATCDGTVLFTDLSLNTPTSWTWDFGDGNTSTSQNPTHSYQTPGTYDVTLINCNAINCDTLTRVAYVNYDPAAPACLQHTLPNNSSINLSGCNGTLFDHSGPNSNYLNAANDTVYITPPGATSISLTFLLFELENSYDYLHIFDGPSTNSPQLGSYTGTALPPVITSTTGAITIVMQTDNSVTEEGFEMTWQCFLPSSPPTANYAHMFTGFCEGIVQFSDLSSNAISWDWDFGDGGTSTLQNPVHTYAAPGSYPVTLIAGNNNGTDTIQQTIVADPFIASAIIPDTMYTGIAVQFDNTSPGVVFSNWDFGNGNSSTQEDPLVTYANVGVYSLTLLAGHGNGCSDTLSHVITVLPYVGLNGPNDDQTTVQLFPVPSEGRVQLAINHPTIEDITVRAYNSVGQLIFRFSDQSSGDYNRAFDFSHQAEGIYLLQIVVGDQLISKKVVIQR